ncbi:MAG: hypothetical protein MZU84_04925 [Sphingobacterium sp.]|nr:hypothetical protein [Sphingobacterium sp.]
MRGLDTVVIYDARYANMVDRGRNVLHRLYLGANEILQMAGRVHGRVPNGEVTILSDRDLDFATLQPTPPEFQLAGDAERVAVTCAALGVRRHRPRPAGAARPHRVSPRAPDAHRARAGGGRASSPRYGREVEAMPVDRAWARAAGARRAGTGADGGRVRQLRLAAPHDPRGARPARRRGERQRPPHRVQHLRRGGEPVRAAGIGVRLPRHLFEEEELAAVGREARRAGEGHRGHRAGRGVHLSRHRGAAAAHHAVCVEADPAAVDRAARAHHAVRPGDRRADGRRAGRAREQDVGGGHVGCGVRQPALLRGPLRRAARRHRGHHAAARRGARARRVGRAAARGVGAEEAPAADGVPEAHVLRVRAGDGRRGDRGRVSAGAAGAGTRRTRDGAARRGLAASRPEPGPAHGAGTRRAVPPVGRRAHGGVAGIAAAGPSRPDGRASRAGPASCVRGSRWTPGGPCRTASARRSWRCPRRCTCWVMRSSSTTKSPTARALCGCTCARARCAATQAAGPAHVRPAAPLRDRAQPRHARVGRHARARRSGRSSGRIGGSGRGDRRGEGGRGDLAGPGDRAGRAGRAGAGDLIGRGPPGRRGRGR